MPTLLSPFVEGGDTLSNLLGLGGSILNYLRGNTVAGQMLLPAAGTGSSALSLPAAAAASMDYGAAGCPTMYAAGAARVSPVRTISQMGPDGRCHEWRYKGRALLYADDLQACKRVERVARRASKAVHRSRRGGR